MNTSSKISTPSAKALIDLETKFWQSIVEQDPNTAVNLLKEPALMVSTHGTLKFDRNGYRKMAEQGTMSVTSFELKDVDVVFPNDATAILTYRVKQALKTRSDGKEVIQEMNDTSTWVRDSGDRWLCVMHTETPVEGAPTKH